MIHIFAVSNVDTENLIIHEGAGSIELTKDELLTNEKVTTFTKELFSKPNSIQTNIDHGVLRQTGVRRPMIKNDRGGIAPAQRCRADKASTGRAPK